MFPLLAQSQSFEYVLLCPQLDLFAAPRCEVIPLLTSAKGTEFLLSVNSTPRVRVNLAKMNPK